MGCFHILRGPRLEANFADLSIDMPPLFRLRLWPGTVSLFCVTLAVVAVQADGPHWGS